MNAKPAALQPSHHDTLLLSRDRLAVRVTVATLVEAGGLWLLALLGGVVMMAALLLAVQAREVEELRRARLQVTLSELGERLEKDLALGFDLGENYRAQALIEQLLDRDRGLNAIEIFDVNGLSLFNTDRGSIGEKVPASWLAAGSARKGHEVWQVNGADDAVCGMSIYGPFGEAAGHVAVTIGHAALPDLRRFAGHVFLAALLLCIVAPLAVRWALMGDQAPMRERLAGMAADRVLQAHVRLQIVSAALRDGETGPA